MRISTLVPTSFFLAVLLLSACRTYTITENQYITARPQSKLLVDHFEYDHFIGEGFGEEGPYYWIWRNGASAQNILFFPGSGTHPTDLDYEAQFEWLHQLGYTLIVPDYPGHGLTEGELSIASVLAFGEQFVKDAVWNNLEIDAIWGYSLGTIAAQYALRDSGMQAVPVILEGAVVPPTALVADVERKLGWPKRWLVNLEVPDSLADRLHDSLYHNLQPATWFLHGQNDGLFPPELLRRYVPTSPQIRFTMIDSATHAPVFPQLTNAQRDSLRDFLYFLD